MHHHNVPYMKDLPGFLLAALPLELLNSTDYEEKKGTDRSLYNQTN